MFNRKIVFVLGAGANCECGFPLGSSLKERVRRDLWFYYDGQHQHGDQALQSLIIEKFESAARSYLASARKLSSIVNQFISIDEALHFVSDDTRAIDVGKAAIVNIIAQCELSSHLCSVGKEIALGSFSDSWLGRFFKLAISGLKKSEAAKSFSNTTIINFNYDRSLEEYLFQSLQRTADYSVDEARLAISTLNIIRPYGSLGLLDWQNGRGTRYGLNNPRALFDRGKEIRAYTESDIDEVRDEIRKSVEDAWVVIFLGFGFHEQNMKLFQLERSSSVRQVFATTVGIDPLNYPSIDRRIRSALCLREGRTVELVAYESAKLLEMLRPSIMALVG